MISHPFTQPLDPLQCFIRKLNRLEETFSVSPLSELEQEGAVRRMRFAVDAGLKAMKDHLATSGHLPDVPTRPPSLPPRGGGGSSLTGTSGWTCFHAGASLRGTTRRKRSGQAWKSWNPVSSPNSSAFGTGSSSILVPRKESNDKKSGRAPLTGPPFLWESFPTELRYDRFVCALLLLLFGIPTAGPGSDVLCVNETFRNTLSFVQ